MTGSDEARLIEKLRAIEALYARPGSPGERIAAGNARERILERLREVAEADPPVEYRFSMGDLWARRVFVALLRRYDITPYRRRGQRYTTVMAKVSKRFVDETLWPEFEALVSTLRAHLDEVTNRVVAQVIHADVSEAAERDEPKQLTLDATAPAAAPPAPAADARPPDGDPPPQGKHAKKKNRKQRRNRKKGRR